MFISQSDEVKKMSLSNFTARKLIKDIHKLMILCSYPMTMLATEGRCSRK